MKTVEYLAKLQANGDGTYHLTGQQILDIITCAGHDQKHACSDDLMIVNGLCQMGSDIAKEAYNLELTEKRELTINDCQSSIMQAPNVSEFLMIEFEDFFNQNSLTHS